MIQNRSAKTWGPRGRQRSPEAKRPRVKRAIPRAPHQPASPVKTANLKRRSIGSGRRRRPIDDGPHRVSAERRLADRVLPILATSKPRKASASPHAKGPRWELGPPELL